MMLGAIIALWLFGAVVFHVLLDVLDRAGGPALPLWCRVLALVWPFAAIGAALCIGIEGLIALGRGRLQPLMRWLESRP